MKQRAKNLLTNYKIPAGLEFKYLPGEEILVDSFSFVSSSLICSYIGFITNERFIFKQTQGLGSAEELKHADMKFINSKDITGIVYGYHKLFPFPIGKGANLRILGKVVDFSPEGDSVNFDVGVAKYGGFLGGLSYSDNKNFEKVLLPVLKKLSEENEISFGTSEEYSQFATVNSDETAQIIKKANSLYIESYKTTLYVLLGLIGILALWILISLTSFTFVFLLGLLIIGGFFAYKKYIKSWKM